MLWERRTQGVSGGGQVCKYLAASVADGLSRIFDRGAGFDRHADGRKLALRWDHAMRENSLCFYIPH